MKDSLHKALKPIKHSKGLWWVSFWRWPNLLRECHDEINQTDADLSAVRESFRREQERSETLERLATESRELARKAIDKASDANTNADNLTEELGNAKVQLQKASETVGCLEGQLAKMEMEGERLKAELSKTKSDLTRKELELDKEQRAHRETRIDNGLLQELVHRLNRLEIPTRRGIKAVLANTKRFAAIWFLFLPLCVCAQFPPPFWYNPWTTNRTPIAVQGQDNLSVTNLGSGTNWLFYEVGPKTVARLMDVTNIAGAAGGNLTTNANQFLGVPLSIKTGAFQTNLNAWGNGTNSGDFYIFTNLFMNGVGVLLEDTPVTSTLYVGPNHDKSKIGLVLFVDSGLAAIYPGVDGGDDNGLAAQRWNIFYGYSANLAGQAFAVTLAATNGVGSSLDIAKLVCTNGLSLTVNSNGNVLVDTGVFWTNSSRLFHMTNAPGLDRQLVFWNTNGQGYTALSGPTNAWLPTNRFFLFVTNAQVGQALKVLSVASDSGVTSIVLTNDFFQPSSGVLSNLAGTGAQTNGMNVTQFLTNSPVISMRAGALLTNIVIQQSNNTSVSLLVTNNPGSTMNLVEMLNTNLDGVVVRSNGAVKVTANEASSANGTFIIHNKGANQTYLIWTNSSGGNGSAIMRTDSSGNAVFSPINAAAQLFLCSDGGSGQINFQQSGAGTYLATIPDNSALTWQLQGGSRRTLITNFWDGYFRTNIYISKTNQVDGFIATNDIRFLGHNATSNNVWTCTNSTTGEGEWRTAPGATLTTNANQFGASVQLTIKDGAFFTNAVFYPGSPGLTVTNYPGLGTNSFQLLNSNGVPVIYALTNNGLTLVSSNQLVLGAQTNAASKNIAGGVTNWIQTESKGTLYASSNLLVKSGQSASNAWVGGTTFFSIGNFTNLNGNVATFSNLANCTVPAHTLTNNGDMIRAYWGGVAATAMQNTQNFQIVYGSITLLDTGLQIGSNYLFNARVAITRTGNTSQHVEAQVEWLPRLLGTTGLPFASTNVNVELAETNGIDTALSLKASARRVGALTNNSFRVYYDPAVR